MPAPCFFDIIPANRMMKTNFHTHTIWCDGTASVEAMIEGAIARDFAKLGFSSHSDMLKDPLAYCQEVRQLKVKYQDALKVFCGIEAEYEKTFDRSLYDYVIGSVHYVDAKDGARVAVDLSPNELSDGIKAHFKGDAKLFIQRYFAKEREMLKSFNLDIAGHLDLIRKFNDKLHYFDEKAPWYLKELDLTAEAAQGKLVEVNTGALARGWMDDVYPSKAFRDRLREAGAKFILASDAHSVDTLDCAFDRYCDLEVWSELLVR